MSAPENTNILNMTGIWSLNSVESDDLDATFAVQGIPWIIRKVIAYARLEIEMKHEVSAEPNTQPATIINVKQTVRPGGFDTANRYILDGQTRHDTVPIFGAMSMRARYLARTEVTKEATLGREIEDPIMGEGDIVAIEERSGGVNTGWRTVATWGFEKVNGQRRFCKYCVTTKGEQRAEARLVYDYRAL